MAGRSGKGRNKGRTPNSNNVVRSEAEADTTGAPVPSKDDTSQLSPSGDANGVCNGSSSPEIESTNAKAEATSDTSTAPSGQAKQAEGGLHLYPIPVKLQSGEKLELQLNPGDSVMDIRQFLLDAPETCFFTCYDLILHTKDGSSHHLEDYHELSEIADITSGGCSLEMVATLYDDRSIRSHLRRSRELLSASPIHASLSTQLALQHDKMQKKAADGVKSEGLELEGLGFMEDIPGSLCNLMPSSSQVIKCVESIVFSSFNPPPNYRRIAGDLIYIDAVTLEGNKYCITGTTKSFYVNSSTGNILDPRPSKHPSEATTLIGLLQKLSLKFKKGFREILERKSSSHPFEIVQSLLPPNSWLGAYPVPHHERDAARAEDAVALSYGSELIGMQRDWNEELQSCLEFPHATPQERILRDRALYKVTCDFVEAATSGAIGVIRGCISPINPTDPECFHIFAVDADIGHISKELASSVQLVFQQGAEHVENTNSCGSSECPSNEASDASGEAQVADGEQATYASANNDLKGTKAYQEADVPGLYNLAMAIIDYRGHRVVAQSIIPGILQGDKSDSLLYGSVDNGKKICWDEAFHSKVLEAAARLHLKPHMVLDGSGNAVKLAAPVECKGIVGSDDRHYLLDLMRVTPRDANYSGPGSRFCVLRSELVTSFCKVEAAERSKSTCGEVPVVPESANATYADTEVETKEKQCDAIHDFDTATSGKDPSCDEILLNPNVFTEFKLAGSQEEIAADEAEVRKAGLYLVDVVLPKFVQDLSSLEVSPMDGQTLTEALHAHGINVRYIGKVADMTKHLPHLWDLCATEIIIRSTKHILKDVLRESQDHDLGPAISHFLNCLVGHNSSGGAKNGPNNMQWRAPKKFSLPEDARSRVRKVSAIRNLCLKVGICIAARKYDFESAMPFEASDVLDLQPVIKHSVPVCSEARELLESGKARLAEGNLNEAYTLFTEAFSILQQVTGPMHKEVANCCRYIATVLYHAGDMGGAITQQHKELIINERCLGLDHPDTAHSYGNMALFYHGLNQTELALRHMSRTLLLLSLSSGVDHPDVATTFINVAMMYQDIGKMNVALRYLQEALKKNERLLGQDHIQTAACYHALAIAFNCMGAYKLSIQACIGRLTNI
ncbi:Clustered mitochondria protein [Acorus calamus]|uniref:Clustered mitochondria protein n=1 Tax=Acorus calamus TaxID=4465 RepID=A0AAV9C1A8_ACOCL|nr:Clustered mitochondria protein [Acorus calamus]